MHCVRGTYGGNITDFTDLYLSDTVDLQTVKLVINTDVSQGEFLA